MDEAVAWVPYNLAVLPSGKRVGLDAYYWPSLSRRYRVVLLAQPVERLQPSPGRGCVLPARIGVEEQLREIESVASMRPRPPRLPRPSVMERLLSLIMPPRLLSSRPGDAEAEVPEELNARMLARLLAGARPLGAVAWAPFTREDGVLLPEEPGMASIYWALAERDEGYRAASTEALALCGGGEG